MFGAATGRAEAHTIRLALIYALLDRSTTISSPHLDAALALWRYARDSTRWVFGDSLGDPTADDIWMLAKDRAHGITRTEVRDLFSRNKRAREIDRAHRARRRRPPPTHPWPRSHHRPPRRDLDPAHTDRLTATSVVSVVHPQRVNPAGRSPHVDHI
jgi:hypothetical protein